MANDDYKAAKTFLGISNHEIWCAILGISKDADKSYSCGRLALPQAVISRLRLMKEYKQEIVDNLQNSLREVYDEKCYSLIKDELTNDIHVCRKENNAAIVFANAGKDWFGHHIYKLGKQNKVLGILIFYPKTGPVQGRVYTADECEWVLWKAEFLREKITPGYIENYRNPLNKILTGQVFE